MNDDSPLSINARPEKLTSAHVANYILCLAERSGVKDMTCLKLMKIVYISYAWYLCLFDKEMFSERPQAWKFGPVFPSLYYALKISQDQPIDDYVAIFEPGKESEEEIPIIPEGDKDISSIVVNAFYAYKDKTEDELTDIMHRAGGAWESAFEEGLYSDMVNWELIKQGAMEGMDKYMQHEKPAIDEAGKWDGAEAESGGKEAMIRRRNGRIDRSITYAVFLALLVTATGILLNWWGDNKGAVLAVTVSAVAILKIPAVSTAMRSLISSLLGDYRRS